MSEAFAKFAKNNKDKGKGDGEKQLNPKETKVLRTMQTEAKKAGATLASDGKGGLPPSLVLGVFRRDKWECKKCGGKKNLSLHHKVFHMEDPRQKAKAALVQKQGRRNDPEQLATICEDCHNKIHEEDREENE